MAELINREFLSDDKAQTGFIKTSLGRLEELGPKSNLIQFIIGDVKDSFHFGMIVDNRQSQEEALQVLNRIIDSLNTLKSSVMQLKFAGPPES